MIVTWFDLFLSVVTIVENNINEPADFMNGTSLV